MSLHRCPGCRNLVERASLCCPVCGRSWRIIVIAKTVRWILFLSFLALIAERIVFKWR